MNLRKQAKGRECQIRMEGICSHDSATVVLCHINIKGEHGTGCKGNDADGVWGCSRCHSVLDSSPTFEQQVWAFEGAIRTRSILRSEGKL